MSLTKPYSHQGELFRSLKAKDVNLLFSLPAYWLTPNAYSSSTSHINCPEMLQATPPCTGLAALFLMFPGTCAWLGRSLCHFGVCAGPIATPLAKDEPGGGQTCPSLLTVCVPPGLAPLQKWALSEQSNVHLKHMKK